MNFDPATLEKLLALSDAELWDAIKNVAAMNGITLPSSAPSASDMRTLRGLLKGGKGMSLEAAREIIGQYKNVKR